MFGKIRCDDFMQSHDRLRELVILRLRHNLCEDAKKHIQRGLIIRLGMMEEAILSFDSEMGKSNEPLNHYLVIKLTLFLNAYYLNLAGSLDNLAWALAYQHGLIDKIDENNGEHRKLIGLVKADFLKLLRKHNLESLCTLLKPAHAWYKDIREFRDPAAHRIPLYVPPAVWSEEDAKRAQELDEQAAVLIAEGERESGADLMHQSHNVGQHLPVFIAEVPKIQVYDLAGRIDRDHELWLEVVNNVLQKGFLAES